MDFYDVKTAGNKGYKWGSSGPITRPWGKDINFVIQKPDGSTFSVLCSWKQGTFSVKDPEVLARIDKLIANEKVQSAEAIQKTYTEDEVTAILKEKGYLEGDAPFDDLPPKVTAEG